MYTENDLDTAVAAGAISPEAALALRNHVAAGRALPVADEEHFRLITGFNDIFVAIASVLLLVAVAWLGGEIAPWVGAAGVAVAAWGLAEYFTRQRRMALPSILLLLAFVGGVFAASVTGLIGDPDRFEDDSMTALLIALSGAIAAGGAWLHWRRFRVPITVAAGAAALIAVVFGLLRSVILNIEDYWEPLMLVSGLAVFGVAMWWDMSDPDRKTRRSDVAFWLHLLAAPLIVHPIFTSMGVLETGTTIGAAISVVLLYIVLGALALTIDRRALMVSALAYVLYALNALFEEMGAIGTNVALAALVIGSALLLLSAFWHTARAFLVDQLPARWRAKLPPAHRLDRAEGAPAS